MVSWLVEMLVHGPHSKWLSWRGMKKSSSSSERARKTAFHLNTLYILTVSWNVNSVVRWLLIHFDFSFYRLKKFYYIEMVLFLAFFFPLLILCEAKLIAFFLSWVKWNEQRKKEQQKDCKSFVYLDYCNLAVAVGYSSWTTTLYDVLSAQHFGYDLNVRIFRFENRIGYRCASTE